MMGLFTCCDDHRAAIEAILNDGPIRIHPSTTRPPTPVKVKRMEVCPGSIRPNLNPRQMVACDQCPGEFLTTPSGIMPWHKREKSS